MKLRNIAAVGILWLLVNAQEARSSDVTLQCLGALSDLGFDSVSSETLVSVTPEQWVQLADAARNGGPVEQRAFFRHLNSEVWLRLMVRLDDRDVPRAAEILNDVLGEVWADIQAHDQYRVPGHILGFVARTVQVRLDEREALAHQWTEWNRPITWLARLEHVPGAEDLPPVAVDRQALRARIQTELRTIPDLEGQVLRYMYGQVDGEEHSIDEAAFYFRADRHGGSTSGDRERVERALAAGLEILRSRLLRP